MEGKGWAEGDTGGGGDGGRGVADAPTLWSLGAMSTPAFAIQASEWFDLVQRAHEKGGVTSLEAPARGAASREICTVTIMNPTAASEEPAGL